MTTRKNRAFELRLALLEKGTPGPGNATGGGGFGRRSGSSSDAISAGGRWSRLSGTGSRESVTSSRHGSATSLAFTGVRRRPHRLPELGEPPVSSLNGDETASVKVTNLKFGKPTNEPLPPITPDESEESLYSSARSKRVQPNVPPLDAILEQEKRLREDLNTDKGLRVPTHEVSTLQELGDLSIQKVHHDQDSAHIVNAAAMYNVALLKSSEDDQKIRIRSRLIEAERQLLQKSSKCSSVVIDKYLAMDTGARDNKKLAQIRKEVIERIKSAEAGLRDACQEGTEITEDLVKHFVGEMMEIGKSVQKAFIDLLLHMITTCKAILGEPPCKFAILAVGPLAAGCGNPFVMPLELIVLIGNDTRPANIDYFNNFCHYLHIKILNLGESPLPVSGVKLFTGPDIGSLFCPSDGIPPPGIFLDFHPCSTNISPLMADDADGFRRVKRGENSLFLGAPWRIASLLRHENVDIFGYETCHKIQNFILVDGDKSIVDEYIAEIAYVMKEEHTDLAYRIKYTCDWITSKLDTPEPILVENCGLSSLHMQQLQYELNLLHKLLGAMAVHHQIPLRNHKYIIEELLKMNLIESEDAWRLLLCTSISYYYDLKQALDTQQFVLGESEKVNSSLNNGLHMNWMIKVYYQTLVPCWTCLYQCAKSNSRLSLAGCILYNDNKKVGALVHQRLHEHKNVTQMLRDELDDIKDIPDPQITAILSYGVHKLIGLVLFFGASSRECRVSWNKAMEYKEIISDTEVKSRAFLDMWHNFGILQICKGKLDKALEQLSECLNMSQQVLKDQFEKDIFEAGIYENLGTTQTMLGMFAGALKSFEIACHYRESANKSIGNYVALRYIYYKMGMLNHMLGNGSESLSCLHESYKCHLKLRKNYSSELWDAIILREASVACTSVGQLTLAAHFRNEVGKISKNLSNRLETLGENNVAGPVEYVFILYELGICLMAAKEPIRSTEIFNRLEAFVSSVKYSQYKCFLDVNLALVMSIKAQLLAECGNPEQAEASFTSSLEMYSNTFSDKSMPSHKVGTCHKQLGEVLVKLGRNDEAIQHLDIANEYFQFTYGNKEVHADRCDILKNSALAKRAKGDFVESHTALTQCLTLEENLSGRIHVRVAKIVTEIGITYSMEGLYESAMNSFEQAMNVYRKMDLGSDEYVDEIPRLYVYRARCHIALGRIPQAERCWERAASKGRAIFQRHPSKLNAFIELLSEQANFYRHIDRPDEAVTIRQEILECLRAEGLQEDDPRILSVLFAIGKDMSTSGNTEEAIGLVSQAIDMKRGKAKTTEEILEVASWISELGQIYAESGEQEKSSECYLESLYMKKRHIGHGAVNDDVITSLETIAELHEKKGEIRQALALLKQSLAKSIRAKSEENKPKLIQTLERIALAFQKLGEHESAFRHWNDALTLREDGKQAENHNETLANIHRHCGLCLDGLKRHGNAIEHYHKCLSLLDDSQNFDGKDFMVASTLGDIGSALNNLGRSEEAVDKLQTSSDSLKTLNGEINRKERQDQLASVLLQLGTAYDNCGHVNDAQTCYLESYQLMKDSSTSGSKEIIQLLRALGQLYFNCGQFKEGITSLEEALLERRKQGNAGGPSLDEATILEQIGEGYASISHTSMALKRTTEALQMLRRHFGHKRPCLQIARCLSALAAICFKANRVDDTIAYAKQAIAMYASVLPDNSDHPEMVVLNTILGDCYLGMKKYQDSVIYYKKATQISLCLHNGDAMNADVLQVMGKLQEAQRKVGVYTQS